MNHKKIYDIIIIGGGHAGVEAAYIASQFKSLNIALITMPGVGLASTPCNPSIGGVGKGQVVREIDALGGICGRLADLSGIQYRTLNDSKGYAVQSTRVQIDKDLYSEFATDLIQNISNIDVIYEKVIGIQNHDNFQITTKNSTYKGLKLIVTVGTFLNGKLHTGSKAVAGGRIGHEASSSLASFFENIKTVSAKFKTGTPARIFKNSVDYTKLEEQPSDNDVLNFHFNHDETKRFQKQVSCYLARTNERTMKIIRANKESSPMFNGQIKGVGARYCPSIEDKAYRYPDKNIHHIFVEPEGLKADTVYPSGVSSSLPEEVQDSFLRTISGLEDINVKQYGYAVEYDVIDTTKLNYGLEHTEISGLYFAGQVNGTSGYEEAAGQGLIAGINAVFSLKGLEPFKLSRKESYIGVMIEDLISNTRDEPYRLFTARSENRLHIREDNAIIRMHKYRELLGLSDKIDKYNDNFVRYFNIIQEALNENYISPEDEFLAKIDLIVPRRTKLIDILKFATIDPVKVLSSYLDHMGIFAPIGVVRTVAICSKYDGYIKRSDDANSKVYKNDNKEIDYSLLLNSDNISYECKARIKKIKPETFGQLKLIEGIRPATLAFVANNIL